MFDNIQQPLPHLLLSDMFSRWGLRSVMTGTRSPATTPTWLTSSVFSSIWGQYGGHLLQFCSYTECGGHLVQFCSL